MDSLYATIPNRTATDNYYRYTVSFRVRHQVDQKGKTPSTENSQDSKYALPNQVFPRNSPLKTQESRCPGTFHQLKHIKPKI